jgi:hypothetical protein
MRLKRDKVGHELRKLLKGEFPCVYYFPAFFIIVELERLRYVEHMYRMS